MVRCVLLSIQKEPLPFLSGMLISSTVSIGGFSGTPNEVIYYGVLPLFLAGISGVTIRNPKLSD